MREHNIVCDNCRVEICPGNNFISIGTAYQDGFEIRSVFAGEDAHFCNKQCLVEYISRCKLDPTSPLAACCSCHAGSYDECK